MSEQDDIVIEWGRGVWLHDSLDAAITSAMYASNSDNNWIDRIEVVGVDGASRIIKGRELWQLIGAKEDELKASRPAPEPHVANVYIDGEVLESFYGHSGMQEAEALVARLRPRLGGRVTAQKAGDSAPTG